MKFRGTYANVVSTLALIIALSGGAYAATGGSLILGRSNSASSLTSVSNPRGVAFSFRSKTGSPPFTVSGNSVKVSSLNADKVDGLDSTQLQGRTGPAGPPGPVGPDGPRDHRARRVRLDRPELAPTATAQTAAARSRVRASSPRTR